MRKIYIEKWETAPNDKIFLMYSDGEIVVVEKADFDRAFAAIINATKEDVIRDFAVEVIEP